jgi:hypothetical protein
MDKCKDALAGLKLDPSNPYMQCLAELLEPPTTQYLTHLIVSYEIMLPTLHGKKKDAVELLIASLKKKIISV